MKAFLYISMTSHSFCSFSEGRGAGRKKISEENIRVASTFLSILSNDLFFHDSRDRLRPKRGTLRQNHLPELSRLNCLENQSVCSKSSARLFFIIIFFK